MFPNCGRLYGRRLEKLYRQRKSFKIAIPGIWTLNRKISAMICIDLDNLVRSFIPIMIQLEKEIDINYRQN